MEMRIFTTARKVTKILKIDGWKMVHFLFEMVPFFVDIRSFSVGKS